MKNRLYSIMSDTEDITKQLDDMVNILELQLTVTSEEKQAVNLNSILRIQIRLLAETREACSQLCARIDETILDILHNRL